MAFETPQKTIFIIVSPLNIGLKNALAELEKKIQFYKIVQLTTRLKKPAEKEGTDYYFISWKSFEKLAEENKLIVSFKKKSNYYGVAESELQKAFASKLPVIWISGLKEALEIKEEIPNIKIIFISIPLAIIETEITREKVPPQEILKTKIIRAKRETDAALRNADSIIESKEIQPKIIAEELAKLIQKN